METNNRGNPGQQMGENRAVTKDRRKASDNYRKPPAEHQFKKGVSGNPKGRPKKKVVQPGGNALGSGTLDRMSAMVLAEANRLIPVPEGDEVCEIPAMQALLRTMYELLRRETPERRPNFSTWLGGQRVVGRS